MLEKVKLQSKLLYSDKGFLDDTRSNSSKVTLGMQVEIAIEYSYEKMQEIEKHKRENCLTPEDIYTLEKLPIRFNKTRELIKNRPEYSKTINVTVSKKCKEIVESEAKRQGLSVSDMVCFYIVQYCHFFRLEDI